MPDNLSLSKSNLAFAKLTSTPTEKAWSQSYNAGNLFACLSLNAKGEEDLHVLQGLGKGLFNNLEAEFFTLEEKNLETIKDAIEKSTQHIPETVDVDFSLAYFKDTILYLFILGEGRVIIKRGGKIGTLLDGQETEKKIQTASGYLENEDLIILETNQFASSISDQSLSESLELPLPSDIAEALSVHMHKNTAGDQAAIIIAYHGTAKQTIEKSYEDDENITLADIQTEEELPVKKQFKLPQFPKIPSIFNFSNFIKIPNLPYLSHRKKFFLSIAVVLVAILIVSIFLTKQKQTNSKNAEIFNSIYPPALKAYDEGVGLKGLNQSLSQEDFTKAEKLLVDGKDKFSEGSQEDKQIEELLSKVKKELGNDENVNIAEVSSPDENSLLAIERANSSGIGFSQNADNVYFVTNDGIFAVSKKSGDKTEIIKNDDIWSKAVGIAPFQANLYVLDLGKADGILKFAPSGNNYSKSDYLKQETVLANAKAMAIDSSIWVLFSEGNIKKFLRGNEESFSIKNLSKPLSNPTKIFTDADTDSLYILDNGNNRVVALDKTGAFQKEYSSAVITSAKDFEVLEKDKKINILSGDKIYQIAIN